MSGVIWHSSTSNKGSQFNCQVSIPCREKERNRKGERERRQKQKQTRSQKHERRQRGGLVSLRKEMSEVRQYTVDWGPEIQVRKKGEKLEMGVKLREWERQRVDWRALICQYLLKLACFDHTLVAILIIGQTKMDVVSDGAWHDPGCLGGVGDSTAVSDFPRGGNQLPEDGHQQWAL